MLPPPLLLAGVYEVPGNNVNHVARASARHGPTGLPSMPRSPSPASRNSPACRAAGSTACQTVAHNPPPRLAHELVQLARRQLLAPATELVYILTPFTRRRAARSPEA